MSVPRLLKAQLASRGWGYAQLAELTGYAVQTLRNVAAGSSNSAQVRQRISEILGVEIWPQNEPDRAISRVGMSRAPTRARGPLSRALKIRGMTTDELAAQIGVTRQTVHNLSCGNHRSRKTRLLIESVLRIPVWSEPEALAPFNSKAKSNQ